MLKQRYFLKDLDGNFVENGQGMLWRVANAVAQAEPAETQEKWIRDFYDIMATMDFMPNSPTLMNAGTDIGMLSACFVVPLEDSMEDIFESLKETALITKSGGGVGIPFSNLRASGSSVMSTSGVASGPISFMKVFDSAIDSIKQGGRRRGALMSAMSVHHPDILSFITCKDDMGVLNNMNISVAITDEFMDAKNSGRQYNLYDQNHKVVSQLDAEYVWNKIVYQAWKNGEPGVLFIDTINRANPTPALGVFQSTNPCGEQPLLPHEACNLGSINLAKFVHKGHVTYLDYDRLREVVRVAVRFMDDVITVNKYPLPVIEDMVKQTRKIGLGVMGWADALIMLGIPYCSDSAVRLAHEVMQFIHDVGISESSKLAQEKGVFPAWKDSIFGLKGFNMPMRNATITTIAPTGTISMICDASSGCEPLFGVGYVKSVMEDAKTGEKQNLLYVNPLFEQLVDECGHLADAQKQYIKEESCKVGTPSLVGFPLMELGIPSKESEMEFKRIQGIFQCAHDVTPEYHVRMQAAFQRNTDNAVSKTCNFKNEATEADVAAAYDLAFKLGCKGITVYRDGSRYGQVYNTGTSKAEETPVEAEAPMETELETEWNLAQESGEEFSEVIPRDRPEKTFGTTERIKTGCGKMYLTINSDEHGLCETFAYTSSGGCAGLTEGVSRLVSLALRAGVPARFIIDQLCDVRCPVAIKKTAETGNKSCPDAIGKALRKALESTSEDTATFSGTLKIGCDTCTEGCILKTEVAAAAEDPCPECGSKLTMAEGCMTCHNCGYSKCS